MGTLPVLLGGSWVFISRVISRVTVLITHIRGLITLLGFMRIMISALRWADGKAALAHDAVISDTRAHAQRNRHLL